ncbi:MAG: hypothetical protein A3E82_09380, partial [Gammaproteobacteria bacterium RIFCSPHIGHO2_12_FULL_38_11]
HMDRENPIDLNDSALVNDLKSAGFHAHIIGKAFSWLHDLVAFADQQTAPSAHSFRIFSIEEKQLLSEDCRAFIINLEQQKILTSHTREIVIHLVLTLMHEGVDLHLLKWVTLMVLFNIPDNENALAHMEFLVLSDNTLDNVH